MLFNVLFTNIEDAIFIAEMLNEKYHDYFPIWDAYPDADLLSLVKWSVKDGIKLFEAMRLIKKHKVVTKRDITKAMEKAGDYVGRWTRT